MGVLISVNGVYQKHTAVTGFVPTMANNAEELRVFVSDSDWSPIVFKDGRRLGENFVEAMTLAIDVDNTGVNQLSIDDFTEMFGEFEFYLMTSKSHQKAKFSKKIECPPADRYHVVFPLSEPIKSPHDYRSMMESMIERYPAIDDGAKDGARFFYGFDGTEVFYNAGKPLKITAPVKPVQPTIEVAIPTRKSRLHAMPQVESFGEDDSTEKTLEILRQAAREGHFDDRSKWLECGMAFKGAGLSFDDWMAISWDSEKANSSENRKRWDGFRADRHTKGTLVHFARQFSPGFLVKRKAPENYTAHEATPQQARNSLLMSMPWSKWYQPHVVVSHKKDPLTGQLNELHKPMATIANLEAMFDFYGIVIRENLMKHDVETLVPGVEKSEGKHENASFADILSLCVLNGYPTEKLKEYLVKVAHKKSYHPVREWLEGLPRWDGVDHIARILADVIVLDESKSHRAFSEILIRRWMVSCVASVLEVKYRGRGVMTFQGEQEIGKTAFFRSIMPVEHFGEWFKDGLHVDPKDRDSVYKAVSRWIVELGEIEGMFVKEISTLKAFLTSDEDVLRLPYEAKTETYNRRTVFCATANDAAFLNDPTGNSRFWVLAVKSVRYQHDLPIEQLWAQALAMYRSGERWWLEDGEREALTASNSQFVEVDAYREAILLHFDFVAGNLGSARKAMTATEVARECGFRMTGHKDSRGVARALRAMGVETAYLPNRSPGFAMPPVLAVASNYQNYSQREGY